MPKSIQELLEEYDKQMDSEGGKAYDDVCSRCDPDGNITNDPECECCCNMACLGCLSM